MLGQIVDFKINGDVIEIQYDNGVRYVRVVNENIINFYEKKGDHAIDVTCKNIESYIDFDENLGITIGRYTFVVKEDFLVDLYIDDELVSEGMYFTSKNVEVDYEILEKEGHSVNKTGDRLELLCRSLNEGDYIYGLGDKMSFVNKRGYLYENWNTDDPSAQNENYTRLYKSIPFYVTFNEKYSFGLFLDNTYHTYFDLGKTDSNRVMISSDGGYLDYYFILGDTLLDICSNYTTITGRLDIPSMYTLGHQQSRWGYKSREEILAICKMYRKMNIKCDVIHLDIDYMDHYKVFTTNSDAFGDFKSFVDEVHSLGFKIVCIIDPGVKKEEGYDVYEDLVKNGLVATRDGEVYINEVWPGESVFPAFNKSETRDFWATKVKILLDLGVDGIWNDMNEPASFRGPLPMDVDFDGYKHDEIHNVYAHYMAMATHKAYELYSEKRPYIITRAGYANTSRYSTVWTGDNQSLWHHLRLTLSQIASLSMSGFSFSGVDIGGFGGDVTEELMIRFIEASIFNPLFRNHSALGTREQEPYRFSKKVVDIYRWAVDLRYELTPYMYDAFYFYNKQGQPVVRPVVLNFEDDKNTYEINDSIMLSDSLLLAPIVDQGMTKRVVYLPGGKWYDYFTGAEYNPGYHMCDCPIDKTLLFAREGSIIPVGNFRDSIDTLKEIRFRVFKGTGEYYHYQDDGKSLGYKNGEYNLYHITHEDNKVTITLEHTGYKPYDKITLEYEGRVVAVDSLDKEYVI